MAEEQLTRFVLKYSNHIIEHLGVKLYQNRPTNALAELVSNAWDADAGNVWIDVTPNGSASQRVIVVGDDGSGMSPADVQRNYLIIGRKSRTAPDGRTSRGRLMMGRKGIGKLAPFGIAGTAELLTLQKGQATWIRMDLSKILEEGTGQEPDRSIEYEPDVLFSGTISALKKGTRDKFIKKYLNRLDKLARNTKSGQSKKLSGTLIVLRQLSVTNVSWISAFPTNLVNRIVPVLGDEKFKIWINGDRLSLAKELPASAKRFPAKGWETTTLSDGRKIRHWAFVVDLKQHQIRFDEDWTQEHAGVAVFAHGKIAQDRPFFFGLKGRELYSRYLYGVVDADWVDEFPEDIISTDRGSLNWQYQELRELWNVGQNIVKLWLKETENYLKEQNREKINRVVKDKLNLVPAPYRDKFSVAEVKEMASTILSLAPNTNTQKVVEITFSAVSHIYSWEFLKDLVKRIELGDLSPEVFNELVLGFRLFENANLAQVIARRLKAMLALKQLIGRGAREVGSGEGDETASVDSMHALLKNNSWLLDLRWAAVADELPPHLSHKLIEKRMKRKHNDEICEFERWRTKGEKAIDFFMLHVTEFESVVVVVEIKRADKSLGKREHRQLQDYMDEVRADLEKHSLQLGVRGILIGGKISVELRRHLDEARYPITVMTWNDLSLEAKRSHQEFLRALAMGLHDDPRLQAYLTDLGQGAQHLLSS